MNSQVHIAILMTKYTLLFQWPSIQCYINRQVHTAIPIHKHTLLYHEPSTHCYINYQVRCYINDTAHTAKSIIKYTLLYQWLSIHCYIKDQKCWEKKKNHKLYNSTDGWTTSRDREEAKQRKACQTSIMANLILTQDLNEVLRKWIHSKLNA